MKKGKNNFVRVGCCVEKGRGEEKIMCAESKEGDEGIYAKV